MRKSILSIIFALLTIFSSHLVAQEPPTDIMNKLPDFFNGICLAKNSEVQSYAKLLTAVSEGIHENLESLAELKLKAQQTSKINPNADVEVLQLEYEKSKSALTLSRDFGIEFDKAIHNEAEIHMKAEMEENALKAQHASNWEELERLGNEVVKIRTDYCMVSGPHYLDLLSEQRSVLEVNINQLVHVSALEQKIKCKRFGCTYFHELSYENAYLFILDHLENMHNLLYLAPGNE